MTVDSFKYLPRLIGMFYQTTDRQPELPIPFTPLPAPIANCRFALVTSGGLYLPSNEPAFDIEREKEEPTWGDPSFRVIPTSCQQDQIRVSHLHYNPEDVLRDFNILLPIDRFRDLDADGEIGGLANDHYSFMGFQGYPPDATLWESDFGPQIASRMRAEDVQCVLLTPA